MTTTKYNNCAMGRIWELQEIKKCGNCGKDLKNAREVMFTLCHECLKKFEADMEDDIENDEFDVQN